MGLVGGYRFGGNLVERLDVDEFPDEAFLMEFHHMRGDAAEGEGCLDALLDHTLTDILHSCKGSSASTCLDAESILEVTRVNNHFCSLFCEQYVTRVLGVPDSS